LTEKKKDCKIKPNAFQFCILSLVKACLQRALSIRRTPMAEEKQGEPRSLLPLEWRFPGDITSRYATNMVVQHTQHEFIISFFEAYPPVLLGEAEEREAALEHIESVPAICVARIIVSPERLKEFIQVLQDNLDKYLSRTELE
jgi:hypothetical protein